MKLLRNLTLSLVLLFLTTPVLHAQMQKGLGFGVRAGINLADYTGSKGDFRPGFLAGVYTDMYFSPRWALELGAYYSSQGSKNVITPGTTYGRVDNHLDYAQLQFAVKYNLVGGFRVKAFAQGGYLLNATVRSLTVDGSENYSDMFSVNKYDLGLGAGVGYTFSFGLDLQASYTHGLTPLFSGRSNYNSVYRVTVGWRFIGTGDRAKKKR